MSFLYPRTVSIYRASEPSGAGLQPYLTANEQTVIAANVPASISLAKELGAQPAGLPGDTSRRLYWSIQFQGARGLVQNNDIVIDDAGARYQVTGAWWTPLGYNCMCEQLEL